MDEELTAWDILTPAVLTFMLGAVGGFLAGVMFMAPTSEPMDYEKHMIKLRADGVSGG